MEIPEDSLPVGFGEEYLTDRVMTSDEAFKQTSQLALVVGENCDPASVTRLANALEDAQVDAPAGFEALRIPELVNILRVAVRSRAVQAAAVLAVLADQVEGATTCLGDCSNIQIPGDGSFGDVFRTLWFVLWAIWLVRIPFRRFKLQTHSMFRRFDKVPGLYLLSHFSGLWDIDLEVIGRWLLSGFRYKSSLSFLAVFETARKLAAFLDAKMFVFWFIFDFVVESMLLFLPMLGVSWFFVIPLGAYVSIQIWRFSTMVYSWPSEVTNLRRKLKAESLVLLGQIALDLEKEHMTWSKLVLALPFGVSVLSWITYWFGKGWGKVKRSVNHAIGRDFITDVIEPQCDLPVCKHLVAYFWIALSLLLLSVIISKTTAVAYILRLHAVLLKCKNWITTWFWRPPLYKRIAFTVLRVVWILSYPLRLCLLVPLLAYGQLKYILSKWKVWTPYQVYKWILSYVLQVAVLFGGLLSIIFVQPVHPLIVFAYCLATILYFRTFKVAGSMISLFGLARWAGVVAFGPLAIIAAAVHNRARFDATIATPAGYKFIPKPTQRLPRRIVPSPQTSSSSSESDDEATESLSSLDDPPRSVLETFARLVDGRGDKIVEHPEELEELKWWFLKVQDLPRDLEENIKQVIKVADSHFEKNLVAESLVAIHNDDEDILVTPLHGIIHDDVITTSYLSILARIFRNPFIGPKEVMNVNEMLEEDGVHADVSDMLVLPLTTEGHNSNPDRIKRKSKSNKSGKGWRRNTRRTKPKRRGAGWVNSSGEYAYYTYEEMQRILDDPKEAEKHAPEDRIRMRIALSAREKQTLYGSYDKSQPWMRKSKQEDQGDAEQIRTSSSRSAVYGSQGTTPVRLVDVVSDKGFKGRKFVYGENNIEIFDDTVGAQLVADKPLKKRGLVARAKEAIRRLFFPKTSQLPERVDELLSRIEIDMKNHPELVKQAAAGRHFCEIPSSPGEVKLTTEAKFKTDGIVGTDEARKCFRVMLDGNEIQRCTYVNHKFVTSTHNLSLAALAKIEVFGATEQTKHLQVDIDKVERVAGTDCLMITPKNPGQIRNTLTGKLESMKQNGIINNKHGATPSQGSVVCYVSPDGAVWTGNVVKISDTPVETECSVNGTLKTPAIMTTAGTDKGKGSCGTALYDPATRSIVGIQFASSAELKQNYAINLYEIFKLYQFQGPKNGIAPVPSKP